MDAASEDVFNFFMERHIILKEDWLQAVRAYLKEVKPNKTDSESICSLVFEQWKYSDLSESCYSAFDQSTLRKSAFKCSLKAPIVVQIASLVDIGAPFHTQHSKLTYEFVDNSGFEALPEKDEANPWEAKPRRMILLEISDGSETFRAIEHSPIQKLSLLVKPGCKMLLIPPVTCRRGILQLREDNCQLLGGDVEALMKTGRPVEVMAKRLNIDPSKQKKKKPTTSATSTVDSTPTMVASTSSVQPRVQPAQAALSSAISSIVRPSRQPATDRSVSISSNSGNMTSREQNSPSSSNRLANQSLIAPSGGNTSLLDDDDYDNLPETQPYSDVDELNDCLIEEVEDSEGEDNYSTSSSTLQIREVENRLCDSLAIRSTSKPKSRTVDQRDPTPPPVSVPGRPCGSLSTVVPKVRAVPRLDDSPTERVQEDSRVQQRRSVNSPEHSSPRTYMEKSRLSIGSKHDSSSLVRGNVRKRSSALHNALDNNEPSPNVSTLEMDTVPLFDPRKKPGSNMSDSPLKVAEQSRSRIAVVDPKRRPSKPDIRKFIPTTSTSTNEIHSPPKKKPSDRKTVKVEVIELSDSDEDIKPIVNKSIIRASRLDQSIIGTRQMDQSIIRSRQIDKLDITTTPSTSRQQPRVETPPQTSSPVVRSNNPFAWPPNENDKFWLKFRQLNVLSLREAVEKTRYSVGSSVRYIQAIMCDVLEPLRIVDDMWTQKIMLRDASMELACFMSNAVLTDLIGLTSAEAASINASEDVSRQQDGAKRLKAVESQMSRLDLLFHIEFYSSGGIAAVIRKVSTVAQALDAV